MADPDEPGCGLLPRAINVLDPRLIEMAMKFTGSLLRLNTIFAKGG